MSRSINSPVTIYLFPEPWENRLFGPIDRISIIVNSRVLTVQITVPTGDFHPDNGAPDVIESWLQRIQGPAMSSTGITEEERELLLHFALGYRAFFTERKDIPESAYYEFVGHFVAETLALRQPEPAAHALEAAIEWLHGNLPADVFDAPNIDIPPVSPYVQIPGNSEVTGTLANVLPATSATPVLIEMCALLMRARTSCGEHDTVASWLEGTEQPQAPPRSVDAEHPLNDDEGSE